MKAKIVITALGILALAGVGAYALYQSQTPPGLSQTRANPALFSFGDYNDKVSLHTRLSALFPRGTKELDITSFIVAAGYSQAKTGKTDCAITHEYNRARFHFDAKEKTLIGIQVMDDDGQLWPDFKINCAVPRHVPRPSSAPLTPESSSAEQPIHLPLEPIPGVE